MIENEWLGYPKEDKLIARINELSLAKIARKDAFYTQLSDIERYKKSTLLS